MDIYLIRKALQFPKRDQKVLSAKKKRPKERRNVENRKMRHADTRNLQGRRTSAPDTAWQTRMPSATTSELTGAGEK